jgi:hypothetical protein
MSTATEEQGPEDLTYVNKEAIDKDLICSICREPFMEPMMVPNCEHIFCKDCISKNPNNNCPTCRAIFSKAQVKPAHRFIVKQLENLQVICTNGNSSCPWKGTREQLPVHKKECTYEKVPCGFSRWGCTFSGTRGEVEKHLTEDCKFKDLKSFLESYLALEKKVQVLEKKVESLQKTSPSSSSSSSSASSPMVIPLLPSSLVRVPRNTPEEDEQLRQLHAAAMRHTNERAEKEKKEKEEKEKKEKERKEKEEKDKATASAAPAPTQ